MRPKSFNFAPILSKSAVIDTEEATARVTKLGQLVISKTAVRQFGFNGKAVNFVWDKSKKALGWQILNGNLVEGGNGWNKRTMRILKSSEKTGIISVSIGRLMTDIELEKKNYESSRIQKYMGSMEDREVYYIIIKDKK